MTDKDLQRFWSKVDRSGGCWFWLAGHDQKGYGQFCVNGVQRKAHRVIFEHLHGPIPTGMLVCHECDKPNCVNPSHLWLGSAQDNSSDMIAKSRHRAAPSFGENNGNSKLTKEEVASIRYLYATGHHSQRWIARKFGVSQWTVKQIVKGRIWRRIDRGEITLTQNGRHP